MKVRPIIGGIGAVLALRVAGLRCRSGHEAWTVLERFRYAHRGLHDLEGGVPENSLIAFRRAIGRGFGAELDVHLLADGALAVFHDSDLKRMTGREGFIEDLTAERLVDYPLGGTQETIPQFCEVLALFEGTGLPLVVELKSFRGNHAALCARTMAELDKFRVPYCVESFDPRCLRWLKTHRGEVVRGQLSENFLRRGDGGAHLGMNYLMTNLYFNVMTEPDFIAYRFEDRKRPALRLCKKLYGAHIVHWTVRSREEMETAEREGAQVIFERFVP